MLARIGRCGESGMQSQMGPPGPGPLPARTRRRSSRACARFTVTAEESSRLPVACGKECRRLDPGARYRIEQALGVGGLRRAEYLVGRAGFDYPAAAHDHHVVAHLPDDREVVRDEQVRHAGRLPDVAQQVEDLRLDGDVQRGDRFVAGEHAWLAREGAGDGDALALPAGQCAGQRLRFTAAEAYLIEELRDPVRSALGVPAEVQPQQLLDAGASGLPRVEGGIGILEMIWTSRPRRLRSLPLTCFSERSLPPTRMRPRVGRSSPTIIRASVDFPEPDSPTIASDLPGVTEKEVSSTATSGPADRCRLSEPRN